MQSCVHSFFFLPDRPTHLHEREGDGKGKILWGWPYIFCKLSQFGQIVSEMIEFQVLE